MKKWQRTSRAGELEKKGSSSTGGTRKRGLWDPVVFVFAAAGFAAIAYVGFPSFTSVSYKAPAEQTPVSGEQQPGEVVPAEEIFIATHVPIPSAVKAIYMTACVAATPSWRESMAEMIEETELNTMIIDIKDYTGGISFDVKDERMQSAIGLNCYVSDMREFVADLHARGIYVIGRITVFQDPHLAKSNPELAVKKESDKTALWKDYKGLSYIDPGSEEGWNYTVSLAVESYEAGFDELNFDYIRFPSDGNMRDMYFPFSEEQVMSKPYQGKADVMRDFFAHLDAELSRRIPGAVLSADLFGMVTTNRDDLNIGQILEYAAPYFDYIAPMVYPSHYPKNFNGWANPNNYPYEVVKYSMDAAVKRLEAASTTPLKLRPWLQDFDYGGTYGAAEVREQIQATYDAGLTSWMLWDPSNRYTLGALEAI